MNNTEINKNKKKYLIVIIILVSIILVVGGVTYAFFQAEELVGETDKTPVEFNSSAVDSFLLAVDKNLTFNITPETLPKNGDDYSDTATASIKVRKGTNDTSVTHNYYLYFVISDNSFIYSGDNEPEIVLSLTKNAEDYTADLGDLKYNATVKGYDVTTFNGVITIANGTPITSNSNTEYTEDVWQITLTYRNLENDQVVNAGNSLDTNILLQKQELSFAQQIMYAKHLSDGKSDIYYHDGQGLYENVDLEAGDYSYRYVGGDPDNYVCFGTSDKDTCLNDTSSAGKSKYLYRIIGVFNKNFEDTEATKDYQLKLIKAYPAAVSDLGSSYNGSSQYAENTTNETITFYWQGSSKTEHNEKYETQFNNNWGSSELNTAGLNGYYYNSIGSDWKDYIDNHTWKVGGNTFTNLANTNAKTAYTKEIVETVSTGTDGKELIKINEQDIKIGLMYMSDYYYAATPTYWSKPGRDATSEDDYRTAKIANADWLAIGSYEWTIARVSEKSHPAFHVHLDGNAANGYVYYAYVTRPVFYLKSSVKADSGTGKIDNPYIISL